MTGVQTCALPIFFCEKCNRDTTVIDGYDGEYGLTYHCTECGHSETADIRTASGVKLGWRVDWPMRWQFEKTVFEPAGKDHHSQGGSFDTARLVAEEIYNWPAPVTFRYDFIGIKGTPGKMSSSKGQVIALPDVLRVYPPEIVRYMFAGTRPNTEFSISFDLDVLKTYEDYDKTERIAWGVEKAKNDDVYAKERRIYELSQVNGMPEVMPYQMPLRHLCNLLQTNSGNIDAVIASLPDVKPEQLEGLKTRCRCAWYWITECAPEDFRFALKTVGSKVELNDTELTAIKKIYQCPNRGGLGNRLSLAQNAETTTVAKSSFAISPSFYINFIPRKKRLVGTHRNTTQYKSEPVAIAQIIQRDTDVNKMFVCGFLQIGYKSRRTHLPV